MMTHQSMQTSEVRGQRSAVTLASSPRIHRIVNAHRAFSLVEVLLAIFILGVGVISIAALFPAGIAQQRMSADDITGPTVANNALAIIRSKLSPDDFGVWPNPPLTGVPGVTGDTLWLRPAFTFGAQPSESEINIFLDGDTATEINFYNTMKYPNGMPDIRFNQGERYYPMTPLKNRGDSTQGFADGVNSKPQYVWDCMFRKFQGKVLVAIFVYRVNLPGGGSATYRPAAAQAPLHTLPPVPVNYVLAGTPAVPPTPGNPGSPGHGGAPWPVGVSVVTGSTQAGPYNPDRPEEAWEEPRQWILDQNNNIHRIVGNFREGADLRVEFARAIPRMAAIASTIPAGNLPAGSVNRIWYMPLRDQNGVSITPVYLTVKEL
jgi:hypothetical protein